MRWKCSKSTKWAALIFSQRHSFRLLQTEMEVEKKAETKVDEEVAMEAGAHVEATAVVVHAVEASEVAEAGVDQAGAGEALGVGQADHTRTIRDRVTLALE